MALMILFLLHIADVRRPHVTVRVKLIHQGVLCRHKMPTQLLTKYSNVSEYAENTRDSVPDVAAVGVSNLLLVRLDSEIYRQIADALITRKVVRWLAV